MRRFYAPPENFKDGIIVLDFGESKHLRDVLRLRIGDEVSVFDGEGNEFSCSIKDIGKKETSLRILERLSQSKESCLDLKLAVSLLKGEKFDLVIQKACELGASEFVPLQTKRADVKLKDAKDIEKRIERWQRIALEAAKQCGRSKLPKIQKPIAFENFIKDQKNSILFSERGGESFESYVRDSGKLTNISAIIGPEGGWEDTELLKAKESGVRILTLKGRVMRAETAAIAITAILQHRFGDLV